MLERAELDNRGRCSVTDRYLAKGKRIDPFNTGDVEAKLPRRTATLVMCIDATDATKVVLRRPRVPLI